MKKLLCSVGSLLGVVLGLPLTLIAQNGSLDATFQAEANSTVRAIAVQTNGQVLIAGEFTSVNGVPRNYIARLNADGDLDRTFNPGSGANSLILTIELQPDGTASSPTGNQSSTGICGLESLRQSESRLSQAGLSGPL